MDLYRPIPIQADHEMVVLSKTLDWNLYFRALCGAIVVRTLRGCDLRTTEDLQNQNGWSKKSWYRAQGTGRLGCGPPSKRPNDSRAGPQIGKFFNKCDRRIVKNIECRENLANALWTSGYPQRNLQNLTNSRFFSKSTSRQPLD